MSAVPVEAGFRDFAFGSSCNSTPSGEKPESKLWYNDGFWWGSLCTPSNVYHIHRLDLSTQAWVDTGVKLDPRPGSKADTLWDGQKLYVVSGLFTGSGSSSSSPSQWSRLYRYSYDTATDTYSLDPGFPVDVSRGRPEAITVANDSTGTLWVTYTEGSRVKINHSIGGNDANWGTPFDLPAPNATGLSSDDISAVIAYEGQIGVMWSNQITDDFHFAVHEDGDGDTAADWQSGIANTSTGNFADDHINLKSLPGSDPAGTLFAVVKTNYNTSNQPAIVLLVCRSAALYGCASTSNWDEHTVYLGSNRTRPILAINTAARELHVFASPTPGGDIRHKTTDLDDINFPTGPGTLFIQNPPDDLKINNASSSKHTVDSTTDLAVIATDGTSRFYLHNFLSLTPTPDIGVTPPSHNYGSVVVGASVSQTFVVSNTGTGDLSVSTTTLGGTDAGQFSIVSGGGAFTLTPGQTRNVVVSFNPSSLGAKSASLNITSNDLDENSLAVPLSGTGVTTAPVTHEETVTGGASNSSSVATAADLTGVTGHLYLAAIAATSSKAVSSISGLGLSWSLVRSQCSGGGGIPRIEVWRAQGTPSGNGTVTASFLSAPSHAVIAVSRYSGAGSIGAIVSGNTNGVNGACSGGVNSAAYSFNLSTTVPGAVVYGAASMRNRTHTPGAGYTERVERAQGSGGTVASVAIEDRTVTSASIVAVSGTLGGLTDWGVIGLEIKP